MSHSTFDSPIPQDTNWQEIDTSTPEGFRALDRCIAKRLGWRFERPQWMGAENTYIFHPDGTQMHHMMGTWTSVYHESHIHDAIKPYATDASAALELWNHVHVIFTPRLVRMYTAEGEMVTVYKAVILANVTHEQYEAVEKMPSLAICKSWLAWHDANGGQS